MRKATLAGLLVPLRSIIPASTIECGHAPAHIIIVLAGVERGEPTPAYPLGIDDGLLIDAAIRLTTTTL